MLETAVEAARLAGRLLAERYPGGRNVSLKGYRDLVTDADKAAEATILELIRARFPGHAILSEEGGGDGWGDGYTWLIDPLDGTTNYSRRLPIFSVSVAVLYRHEPVAGVVYDPLRDHLFEAERGGGTRLNGAPLRVSEVDNVRHTLVGLDWAHLDAERAAVLAALQCIAPRCGTLRGLGSAALGLAYVAAGWLDAYFHIALKPWDVAAGVCLISEAGGRCTALDGGPYRVQDPGCLCTNGRIHEPFVSLLSTVTSTTAESASPDARRWGPAPAPS